MAMMTRGDDSSPRVIIAISGELHRGKMTPQQLRFWALRNYSIPSFECISSGMPCQYLPWPKNEACEGSSATVWYSRQLVLEGP